VETKKIWKLVGLLGILMGILIVFTPFKLAHVCTKTLELTSGMMVPMKCHWTGVSEVVLGVLVAVTGLIIFLVKDDSGRRYLALMLGVIGIAVIITPTSLGIGICGNPEMACHTTKMALNFWGGALIVVALVSQFLETKHGSMGK
jgi:hypothetical protein